MASPDTKAVWPGWETVRLIGRGSFGAVYEIERDVFGHKEKAAMKLISIPLVTVFGLELGSTLAFALVTETIFNWPGLGKLIIDSIASLDRPVMVAYLMMVSVLFVVINLSVDLAYAALDPRLRLKGR